MFKKIFNPNKKVTENEVQELLSKEDVRYNELKNSMDVSLIKCVEGDQCVAWVPFELLFVESVESAEGYNGLTKEWWETNGIYLGKPLLNLSPHKSLFGFFINGTTPEPYLKWYREIHTSRNIEPPYDSMSILNKRQEEFIFMQNELGRGMQFFVDAPIMARWNQSAGVFNVKDGHHRAWFLHASGIRNLPVQMNVGEYLRWRNDENVNPVIKLIEKQDRKEYYTPIPHPYFMELPAYRDKLANMRLDHVLNYVEPYDFRSKKVIDIGSNLGHASQYFYRRGSDVTCFEPFADHYEAACVLNILLHTKCTMYQERFEDHDFNTTYDVGIILTVFYHYYNNPILKDDRVRDRFLEKLDTTIDYMLIWESGDDYEGERSFIIENTKFKKFKHIAWTYGTGKLRELGVFYKGIR